MARGYERIVGTVNPETGRRVPFGQIVEVGRRDGHFYAVIHHLPTPEGRGMDLHTWITQQVERVEQLIGENEWPPSQAEGVRLRCEADRRILDRHRSVNDGYSVACDGCGYDGSYCPEPVTSNINDCPELLDLAHAHGITPDILAGLDRPQPPKREPSEPGPLGQAMAQAWGDQILAGLRTTCIVPAALRGPNWKASS